MRTNLILLSMMMVVISGCGEDNVMQNGQRPMSMNRQVNLQMDYLLYLPEDYGKVDKQWPLMVFLHGAGERGGNLDLVKMYGPAKLAEEGKDLGFIIVSPQCPEGKWWSNYIEKVMALVDEACDNYDVDQSRIYLTGLSMGGYGTWAVASTYPDRFAAIAPVCGGGHPFIADNLKGTPVWAFHGAKDDVVSLSESQNMVNAVNAAGGAAKLTIYPEANHDSWTKTYDNPELYKWLLEHSTK